MLDKYGNDFNEGDLFKGPSQSIYIVEGRFLRAVVKFKGASLYPLHISSCSEFTKVWDAKTQQPGSEL